MYMTLLRAMFYWIACFLASVYLALLLAGCSTVPYWVQDVKPVTVFAVIEVNYVRCGDDAMNIVGCANHLTGLIQIKRGHPLRDCIETHERKHLAGWSHPANAPLPLAFDCGDGRIYPGGNYGTDHNH